MATKKEQGGAKAPVYLVCGNDDLTALRKAEEIVAGLCPPEEQAFGLETIVPGGEEKTADVVAGILKDTMQALLTAPFLGGRKTVYLKGAPFFDPLTDPGRFADVKAATARMAEIIKAGLPEGVSFVLLTSKINKSTTFYKTFQSLGQVWEFNEATQAREASVNTNTTSSPLYRKYPYVLFSGMKCRVFPSCTAEEPLRHWNRVRA